MNLNICTNLSKCTLTGFSEKFANLFTEKLKSTLVDNKYINEPMWDLQWTSNYLVSFSTCSSPVCCCCCCLLLVSGPRRHAQIMKQCGLKHTWCSNPVPTSDSGQSSPRLWVPDPHYLSPKRQSNMHANDKGRMNGYIGNDNRQRAKDRHRGHQLLHRMGIPVTSLVTRGT